MSYPANINYEQISSDELNNYDKIASDFCQYMTTLSSSGIVAYLAILSFIFPDKSKYLQIEDIQILLITPIFYLSSIAIFVLGLFPKYTSLSLLIGKKKEFQEHAIKTKVNCALWGSLLFIFSGILSIVSIVVVLIL